MDSEQIQVPSSWTADQAATILDLVERLAEAIWHAHGDAITRHQEELHGVPPPLVCPEDEHDDIPF
ncbi:MAG: hypothetical protein GY898_08975 [Proteobacteria bacterium]|jgi:hypothetical protein|nr:hypothetical protein [Pseudomonadota bacterium]MCP4868838.1 hypothetical protein [Pseudomonadota bacterium]